MLGHLKAGDFIDIIEGEAEALTLRRATHLRTCMACSDALAAAQGFHSEIVKTAAIEDEIPEPDWFQFRADVRNTMLSRAAQRQSKSSGWAGWLLRPAVSWGLAVAFAAGLSAGLLVWNQKTMSLAQQAARVESPTPPVANRENAQPAAETASVASNDVPESVVAENIPLEPHSFDPELAAWSQSSVFEEVSQLSDAQAEKLQRLLEADSRQVPGKQ